MKLTTLLWFLAAMPLLSLHGQNQSLIDSLQGELEQKEDTARIPDLRSIYYEYMFVEPSQALKFIEEELDIATESGETLLMAHAMNSLGTYFAIISDYRASKETYQQAIVLFQEAGNDERVSAILNNMSIVYRNLGDLDSALICQMESLEIKERIGVGDEELAASYWNIGNIHSDIFNYPESNVWYRKAAKIYKELDLEIDLIQVNYNIALNLKLTDSLDQALPYFEEAEAYYRANNLNQSLASVLDNMGQIYLEQNQFERAQQYFLQALPWHRNTRIGSLSPCAFEGWE